ncbi:hypothetical protein B0H13DRAFT_1648442 [Mycena leptocephala]|nr:hypothetical protein B0H13DRAFT_1648442 [Mycena leptocephala]
MHATKAETPGIRLGGVLGPRDELAFAILSTFIISPEWIYSFFDPTTPVVRPSLFLHPGADVDPALKNVFPNWVRVCPPLTGGGGGRGCMHMKYMLLFAKSGALRIVIGSANLVPHEWRRIENYVFIQDFPRVTPGVETVKLRAGEKPSEAFPAVLVAALRATGVEEALAIMIRQGVPKAGTKSTALKRGWDWNRVRVALVSSVPGKWEGWAASSQHQPIPHRTGQTRLLRAVQALGCSNVEEYELELDCLTSSIGTYSVPWIAVFRLCAGGRAQALRAYLDRGQKRVRAGPTRVIRVYPTLATIRGTVLGEAGASSISCARAQWMRDAKSRSGGVGMHTKVCVFAARFVSPTLPCFFRQLKTWACFPLSSPRSPLRMILGTAQDDDPKNETESEGESGAAGRPLRRPHAWFYVGSHKFSVSAWGALSGSGFNPALNVVNYELGIVLRLERPEDVDAAVAWERPTRKLYRGGRTVGEYPPCFLASLSPPCQSYTGLLSTYLFSFDSAKFALVLGIFKPNADALSQIPQDGDFFE